MNPRTRVVQAFRACSSVQLLEVGAGLAPAPAVILRPEGPKNPIALQMPWDPSAPPKRGLRMTAWPGGRHARSACSTEDKGGRKGHPYTDTTRTAGRSEVAG
jgi:hypothetical protein